MKDSNDEKVDKHDKERKVKVIEEAVLRNIRGGLGTKQGTRKIRLKAEDCCAISPCAHVCLGK